VSKRARIAPGKTRKPICRAILYSLVRSFAEIVHCPLRFFIDFNLESAFETEAASKPAIAPAQSIPLNIAEGNGKRSLKDRARFPDISRGSALECVAIKDVLVVCSGINRQASFKLKSKLERIVAMLTRSDNGFNQSSVHDDYPESHFWFLTYSPNWPELESDLREIGVI
jgi:four helix bundle protein